MNQRLNQRIIQALGRCNRDESDYGIYILADRRFVTHFSRESSRKGIPKNIKAELDLAENLTESSDENQTELIHSFLDGDFEAYDSELAEALACIPPQNTDSATNLESKDEVIGWSALFESKNYLIAADKFKHCHENAQDNRHLEISAFYLWCHAKATYLEGILGDTGKKNLALELLEQAVDRGGQSAWFNRLRASLYRARFSEVEQQATQIQNNCALAIMQCFNDVLDRLGSRRRLQNWINRTRAQLNSVSHNDYLVGLNSLGTLLGYSTSNPNNSAATDCVWRGVFGNSKELITFEAKIEHDPHQSISASDVGQAHIQHERAKSEFENLGYTIRSSIVTHLNTIDPSAEASIGNIKIFKKETVLALFEEAIRLLNVYRDNWSLDDVLIRKSAEQMILPHLPSDGWLVEALDEDCIWISQSRLLNAWD